MLSDLLDIIGVFLAAHGMIALYVIAPVGSIILFIICLIKLIKTPAEEERLKKRLIKILIIIPVFFVAIVLLMAVFEKYFDWGMDFYEVLTFIREYLLIFLPCVLLVIVIKNIIWFAVSVTKRFIVAPLWHKFCNKYGISKKENSVQAQKQWKKVKKILKVIFFVFIWDIILLISFLGPAIAHM